MLKAVPMLKKGTLFVFYDSTANVHWIDNDKETEYQLRVGLASYLWLLLTEPGFFEFVESSDE